jgi:hypothetical protein
MRVTTVCCQCGGARHGDTFEDAGGIQYLATANEFFSPCGYYLVMYRLNVKNRPGQRGELGGGMRVVTELYRCGGVDNWADLHIVRRLAQHPSVPFDSEPDRSYWTMPRACLSPDGAYVVADSNFGEPNALRVMVIETGFGKAEASGGRPPTSRPSPGVRP